MRRKFIAANWKMNLDRGLARNLGTGIKAALAQGAAQGAGACDVGVFPPFTLIRDVAEVLEGSAVLVGAQDCHPEDKGAFTGEVSARMVRDAGATHVILGHSERRQYSGEDDQLVHRKVRAALRHGLKPLVCVGERLEERDGGRTLGVVEKQVRGALTGIERETLAGLAIAYEPVWAIGTGRTATPEQAVEVHRAIRAVAQALFGAPFASALRILYGGSVNKDNASHLLSQEEIDGALVGGASLTLDGFMAIVSAVPARAPDDAGARVMGTGRGKQR